MVPLPEGEGVESAASPSGRGDVGGGSPRGRGDIEVPPPGEEGQRGCLCKRGGVTFASPLGRGRAAEPAPDPIRGAGEGVTRGPQGARGRQGRWAGVAGNDGLSAHPPDPGEPVDDSIWPDHELAHVVALILRHLAPRPGCIAQAVRMQDEPPNNLRRDQWCTLSDIRL